MPKDASLYTKPLPTEAGMLAVARPLHTYCRSASRAFMQIKANDLDPRKASEQGRELIYCANALFSALETTCPSQFATYAYCLDWKNKEYAQCKKEERALTACLKEKDADVRAILKEKEAVV